MTKYFYLAEEALANAKTEVLHKFAQEGGGVQLSLGIFIYLEEIGMLKEHDAHIKFREKAEFEK